MTNLSHNNHQYDQDSYGQGTVNRGRVIVLLILALTASSFFFSPKVKYKVLEFIAQFNSNERSEYGFTIDLDPIEKNIILDGAYDQNGDLWILSAQADNGYTSFLLCKSCPHSLYKVSSQNGLLTKLGELKSEIPGAYGFGSLSLSEDTAWVTLVKYGEGFNVHDILGYDIDSQSLQQTHNIEDLKTLFEVPDPYEIRKSYGAKDFIITQLRDGSTWTLDLSSQQKSSGELRITAEPSPYCLSENDVNTNQSTLVWLVEDPRFNKNAPYAQVEDFDLTTALQNLDLYRGGYEGTVTHCYSSSSLASENSRVLLEEPFLQASIEEEIDHQLLILHTEALEDTPTWFLSRVDVANQSVLWSSPLGQLENLNSFTIDSRPELEFDFNGNTLFINISDTIGMLLDWQTGELTEIQVDG